MTTAQELQSEQAFAALLSALKSGRLRSSEFLTMPDLAAILGFPLAPTREAAKRAEGQSLLTILPKRGLTIMDSGPGVTRDCMDMRAALEQEGVRRLLASGRCDLEALRKQHEQLLAEARSDPGADLSRRALATDLSLHDFMSSGLKNPFLCQAYQSNRNRITVIQNARSFLPDRVIPAMEEHLDIIAALQAGDLPAAIAHIERHLHQTLRWWGVELRQDWADRRDPGPA
ncbi:GntR family transcriptional regulator [Paracoccus homiensis]|uniref:DNA-binding transcriptional regulator, GntR family n=1 Tax=Paracoccus homiensis TaxID=364199 RepID=A0A1I0J812_9RHOB|nr:GntR family transcriptional regulator [Paracoccus homiensis]SEU06034.1 DNA-binding transcriptional regulator, GntR family [Paracoccus homiensis]